MEYATLVEIVAGMHLAKYVQSPYPQMGGLFLVAPPGGFKTTIAETMNEFPSAQIITDINVQTLVRMKDHFLNSHITTLACSDFQNFYRRHGSVSSHVEGIIMSLVEEGFRRASFQSQQVSGIPARCCIIGGMTPAFFDSKVQEWEESGFLRRFLFAKYIVDGLDILERAIAEWRRACIEGSFVPRLPANRTIEYKLNPSEVEMIRYATRHQFSQTGPFIICQKIYAVLVWKFGHNKAEQIFKDFAPCLDKAGGVLEINEKPKSKSAKAGKK